jgi:hypothetical protein
MIPHILRLYVTSPSSQVLIIVILAARAAACGPVRLQ